jgi:hypothetical protein
VLACFCLLPSGLQSTHNERLAVFAQVNLMRGWACFPWAASGTNIPYGDVFFFQQQFVCLSSKKFDVYGFAEHSMIRSLVFLDLDVKT